MNKPVIGLLAGLVAIAALVAGCGSSSNSESSSTESTASISKAQFVKQGNKICAEGNKEIEEGFNEFGKAENLSEKSPPTEAQSKKAAQTILIPAIQKELEGIRALGTPEGDEGEVDEILTAAEEGLEKGEENPVGLVEEEGSDPFARADKLANAYGLTVCGEEGGGEEGKQGSEG